MPVTKKNSRIYALLLAVFLIGDFTISNAQYSNKQLISLAIPSGNMVNIQPLKKIHLTRDEIERQITGYIRELKEKVDTSVLFELAQNSAKLDTSLWRYDEIDSSVLATGNYVELNLDSVVNQKKIKNPKELKYYKKLVKEYNRRPPKEKILISYSRPVLDHTKTYAIVGFRSRNDFGTLLFHLENNTWYELGVVTWWVV